MFRSKRRVFAIVGALAVVGILAGIVSGRGTAGSASDPPPRPDLARVSNEGAVVNVNTKIQAVLERTGTADGVVRQLGRLTDTSFYRLSGTPRGTCYGTGFGAGASAELNQFECGSLFPSAEQPVLDASVAERTPNGDARIMVVQGWAADGVASVAILDANDQVVADTPVTRNIYAIDVNALRDRMGVKLIAKDSTGSVVYTQLYD